MRPLLIFLLFLSVSATTSAQRNCPTIADLPQMQLNDPARYERFMNLETFTANYVSNQNGVHQRLINPNGVIVIPVVVHVLHRGESIGTGRNISMAQIQSQIDVLNEDFRRLNADAANTPAAFTPIASDYGFEFRLACQDPSGNTTNGVIRRQTNRNNFTYIPISATNLSPDETAMGIKMTSISGSDPWPTDRYLNIWVADFSDGTLGYATFPADFATNPNVDGVVIETTSMGRTGNVSAPFDEGRTATHEIGHWLNLRHINGDTECGDDFVADTPPQRFLSSGCPGFPRTSTCAGNGPNGDMFMNYMDYTDDGCMNIFTNGQRLRGRAIFETGGPRAAFIDNYFAIQQPVAPVGCYSKIKIFNPNCIPVTWSIVSGNATIISSNDKDATLNTTVGGSVTIRATAGNYISEITFTMTTIAPEVPFDVFTYLPLNADCYETDAFYIFRATKINSNDEYPQSYQWSYRINGTISETIVTSTGEDGIFIFPLSGTYDILVRPAYNCGVANTPSVKTIIVQLSPCGWMGFKMHVSPNPAKDNIYVTIEDDKSAKSVNKQENVLFQLFDINKTILVRQWNAEGIINKKQLSVNGIKAGLYILVAQKGKLRQTKQILISE
jgi:hypothetical protein